MYVIEFTVRQSAEIILFGDIVITVNYPAVTESAGSVAASDYCRYACTLQSCYQSLIVWCTELINRVAYVHDQPEHLDFINFSVSYGVSLLADL